MKAAPPRRPSYYTTAAAEAAPPGGGRDWRDCWARWLPIRTTLPLCHRQKPAKLANDTRLRRRKYRRHSQRRRAAALPAIPTRLSSSRVNLRRRCTSCRRRRRSRWWRAGVPPADGAGVPDCRLVVITLQQALLAQSHRSRTDRRRSCHSLQVGCSLRSCIWSRY